MTLSAVGFGRSFPRIWLIPIGLLIVIFGLAVFGVLSRSVVADFIAWWPVWVGLAVCAIVLRHRKFGRVRASGLVPLTAIVFVGVFITGHLTGWALMPSSTQHLVGPEVGTTTTASMDAGIDGRLVIEGGSSFLYVVEPTNGGGSFGVPTASEVRTDTNVDVDLVEQPDPGLYAYSGWSVSLAEGPVWSLVLDGAIEADLSGVSISSLDLAGSGEVVLDEQGGSVAIDGQFDITVPAGSSVSVVGVASVPATWTLTSGGAESPNAAEGGWSIVVEPGSTLTVTEG